MTVWFVAGNYFLTFYLCTDIKGTGDQLFTVSYELWQMIFWPKVLSDPSLLQACITASVTEYITHISGVISAK